MKPIIYLPASKSKTRSLLRWFIKPRFWFTYRWPLQRHVTITYPDRVKDPQTFRLRHIVNHEKIHAQDLSPWYGPAWMTMLAVLLPLPVFFSGRWFIERRAYLYWIDVGFMSIDRAVDVLWGQYTKPWPRSWMRRWFTDHKYSEDNKMLEDLLREEYICKLC